MRLLLLILGILVGTAELGSSAEAQNYPWSLVKYLKLARHRLYGAFFTPRPWLP